MRDFYTKAEAEGFIKRYDTECREGWRNRKGNIATFVPYTSKYLIIEMVGTVDSEIVKDWKEGALRSSSSRIYNKKNKQKAMKILLSIKPQFVEKIKKGEKRFEFRRVLPRCQEVDTIIVYASKPVGKVVGEMIVGDFLTYPVDEMWERTKDEAGITREEFFGYFHGKTNAHAIEIKSYQDYEQPIPLDVLLPGKMPPQSYCYLNGYEEWRTSNAARFFFQNKNK